MLIIVGTTDSLWNAFHNSTGRPNRLPDWWHHILVPWPFNTDSLQLPQYRWGVSAFYYWDSNGRLKIAGELAADSVIVLPDTFHQIGDFARANAFARALLEAVDPYVDFSLYDRNGDRRVDPGAVTFVTPFLRWGWATPTFNDTTDDGVVLIGGLNGGASIVGYGMNIWLVFNEDTTPRPDPTQEIPRARIQTGIAHEYGHHLGLPDKYDGGTGDNGSACILSNPHSKSSIVGGYSLMTPLKPNPSVDGVRPLSLWDRWQVQDLFPYADWITLATRTAQQNVVIPDYFSSGVIYKVPILGTRQAFAFAAYFQNDSTFSRILWTSGLFVQHIRDTSIRSYYHSEAQEKNKVEDNELAIGQWDTAGVAVNNSTEDPVWGYDLHDIGIAGWGYVPQAFGGFVSDHVIDHDSTYSALSPYDLFNQTSHSFGTRNVFSTFSNPSSDGYVYGGPVSITRSDSFPPGFLIDTTVIASCDTFYFPGYREFNVAQLLASHFVIRNIQVDENNRTVTADIYTNFIQTDSAGALGLPHEKRFAAAGPAFTDRVGLLYQAKGYLYAALSYAGPDDLGWIWEAAFPVDSGVTQASGAFLPYDPHPPMFCVGYIQAGKVKQQCRYTTNMLSWFRPYPTLHEGVPFALSHSMASQDSFLHHVAFLRNPVNEFNVIRWFFAGPLGGTLAQEDVDSWNGEASTDVDIAVRSSSDVMVTYLRGSSVYAAWRTDRGWRPTRLGSGTTPLVDTIKDGYVVVWQDGDSLRYSTFTNGNWSPAYGLTVGELLALDGGVLLYKRWQLWNALPDGVFKRVWDANTGAWSAEEYVMDPPNKSGFHIAPAVGGALRMVFVVPTGWEQYGPEHPPYRVLDYAETDIFRNPMELDRRVVPSLVIQHLPEGFRVQVGSGVPVERFELVDVTGRRVAVVKNALRAVLSPPHRGIFLIRAVLPDGRVAKQKVVAIR